MNLREAHRPNMLRNVHITPTIHISIHRYRVSHYQAPPEFGTEGLRTSTAHCPGHGKKNCWANRSLISFLISVGQKAMKIPALFNLEDIGKLQELRTSKSNT